MLPLLRSLLTRPPEPIAAKNVVEFWQAMVSRRGEEAELEGAILGGWSSDRLGYALAAGYQTALRAMVRDLPSDALVSFCVTEQGGNHPRAIRTTLGREGGGWRISGSKRWSTLGPFAERFLVACQERTRDETGRPRIKLAQVFAAAAGVVVSSMDPLPFVPEVPHAEIAFSDVAVGEDAILPGDGYADYVKPFRTLEDLHVNAAVLGYLLSVAFRYTWPKEAIERLLATMAAFRALACCDPRAPETHLALAGVLEQSRMLLESVDGEWASVLDSERDRWHRDIPLLAVAGKARTRRRDRAWQALEESDDARLPQPGRTS